MSDGVSVMVASIFWAIFSVTNSLATAKRLLNVNPPQLDTRPMTKVKETMVCIHIAQVIMCAANAFTFILVIALGRYAKNFGCCDSSGTVVRNTSVLSAAMWFGVIVELSRFMALEHLTRMWAMACATLSLVEVLLQVAVVAEFPSVFIFAALPAAFLSSISVFLATAVISVHQDLRQMLASSQQHQHQHPVAGVIISITPPPSPSIRAVPVQ